MSDLTETGSMVNRPRRDTLERRAERVHVKLVKFSKHDAFAPRDTDGRMYRWALTTPGYQPKRGYHHLWEVALDIEMRETAVLPWWVIP